MRTTKTSSAARKVIIVGVTEGPKAGSSEPRRPQKELDFILGGMRRLWRVLIRRVV